MFWRYLKIMLVSLAGSVVTWHLSIQLGLGPVVASGMVGVVAGLLLPAELAVAAYTASFAGMSSAAVLASFPMVILAGALVGVIFILALPVYQGFGGKLGTIAACAVLLTVACYGFIN